MVTVASGWVDRVADADQRRDAYRRTFDLAVSVLLAVLTLPVLLLVVVGSAIALRTWPFFTQQRVGRDGELFTFVKVRTLPPSVPAYIDKHALAEHATPRFCELLRRLHLDELPQVYLVLIGRMSLVGPRPEMQTLHDRMDPTFARQRTEVRPGCTGLWQVSVACTELIGDSPEYDRFYLAARSLRLDLWILARTALQMVGLSDVVTLDDVPRWALPRASQQPEQLVLDLSGDAESASALVATR